MNTTNDPQPGNQGEPADKSLKAVAIDLFKKSQRLPPISLLMRKREKGTQRSKNLLLPPHPFEFADFYHL